MKDIEKKVYLVTGGAQGIGKSTVERIVEEGGIPVIFDTHEEYCSILADKLKKEKGIDLDFIVIDIGNIDLVKRKIEQTYQKYGRLDGMVHCAFNFIIKGLEATNDDWERVLKTNITGFAMLVKHSSEYMEKVGGGAIVCVASISGLIAQPNFLTYSACKAAQIQMCKNLSLDLASKNIRINSVSPGTVWTENNAYFISKDFNVDREGADAHPLIGGKHILARVANPEEISGPIVFLLSSDSSFITGQNIVIDGGYTII